MDTASQTFETKYNNGAAVKVIYHKKPDPKYHYGDRIELLFETVEKKKHSIRMSVAEAVVVINLLSAGMDAFLSDRLKNPAFDVPLDAI